MTLHDVDYGFMSHITCRLTAKNRDRLRKPTLGNRVWATFTTSTFNIYYLTFLHFLHYSTQRQVFLAVIFFGCGGEMSRGAGRCPLT